MSVSSRYENQSPKFSRLMAKNPEVIALLSKIRYERSWHSKFGHLLN